MFGGKTSKPQTRIDSMIGEGTVVEGNVIFSGGLRVQNWTNSSGNTWKTTLPSGTQNFENLFYNGARRLRPVRNASPYSTATTISRNW